MKKIIASAEAPVKVIISGEHGVVHGAPGIAIALEPCNKVIVSETVGETAGQPGLGIKSDRGSVFVKPDGSVEGSDEEKKTFEPFVAVVAYLKSVEGALPAKQLVAEIFSAHAPKGTGNSASIAAALALALFKTMGKTPKAGRDPSQDELWMASQAAEEKAHGGRPSGIDAMAVSRGNTMLLRTLENGAVKWNFTPRPELSFPKGTELLIVDTYKTGERANTGAMVFTVAKHLGLTKKDAAGKEVVKPFAEFAAEDHKKVEPFRSVFAKVEKNLRAQGNAIELGAAFNENHALLKKLGASTAEIEQVIAVALEAGALGAKLTGAGGNGGALIVLVESSKKKQVEDSITRAGFSIFEAKAAGHGARIL